MGWEDIETEPEIHYYPIVLHWIAVDRSAKRFGSNFGDYSLLRKEDSMTYYAKPATFTSAGEHLLKKIIKSPEIMKRIERELLKSGKQAVSFAKKASRMPLSKKTNKQLLQLYESFNKKASLALEWGTTCSLLEMQRPIFSSYLKNRFNSLPQVPEGKSAEYFNLLSTPTRKTHMRMEELALIEIALNVLKNRKAVELFKKKSPQKIQSLLPRTAPKIDYLFSLHAKRFPWIVYVYEGPVVGKAHFIESLKHLLQKTCFRKKLLLKEKNRYTEIKTRQRKLLKKLKMGKEMERLFSDLRMVAFLKVFRKELMSRSYYHVDSLLDEISKRLYLSVNQTRMVAPWEMESFLVKRKITPTLLNERMKLSMALKKGKSLKIVGGDETRKWMKEVEAMQEELSHINEFSGDCAFPGKAKGTVKILNSSKDLAKMRKGNILVSSATNPFLVSAMKKASAIVTDAGGITSHAAIISRELKIPCVIGTRVATKALEDNLLVEVDATKGTVKRLSK